MDLVSGTICQQTPDYAGNESCSCIEQLIRTYVCGRTGFTLFFSL